MIVLFMICLVTGITLMFFGNAKKMDDWISGGKDEEV